MNEEPPNAGITEDAVCSASAKSHQPRDLGIELVEENRFLAARDGWPRKTAARASLPTFVRAICNRSPPGSPARIARTSSAVRTSSGALSPGSPVRDGVAKIINFE
jgi:hypothetical protein